MAQRSRTTSRPSTRAVPASGVSSVTRIRKSVVLPAPSGPMKPNSSPGRTSNDTPSSAAFDPKRLTTLSAVTEIDIHRHPDLEQPLVVGHTDLHGVHQVGALVARLDRRRREFRGRCNPGDG